jgi:hypothetical protein
MKWIKASERLPDTDAFPDATGGIDIGSQRLYLIYKGEKYAGRYVKERWGYKNVFAIAEFDSLITEKEFHDMLWLDESPSPVSGSDAVAMRFAEWTQENDWGYWKNFPGTLNQKKGPVWISEKVNDLDPLPTTSELFKLFLNNSQ